MRFITIPLLIIGYLYWSYISIKNIIYCKKTNMSMEFYTVLWFLHIISIFIGISIIYW